MEVDNDLLFDDEMEFDDEDKEDEDEEDESDDSSEKECCTILEEPFEFSLLPPHIQCFVVEKFRSYTDFIKFNNVSKQSHYICTNLEHSIPLCPDDVYVTENGIEVHMKFVNWGEEVFRGMPWDIASQVPIHARRITVVGGVSATTVQEAMSLFHNNHTRTIELSLMDPFIYGLEDVAKLIEAIAPNSLKCERYLPASFFKNPYVRRMKALDLWRTGCRDRELARLEVEELSMSSDNITSKGLNRILTQWISGNREIVRVALDNGPFMLSVKDVLCGIVPIRIWSNDIHNISFLKHIPREDLTTIIPGDCMGLYALWRPHDRKDMIFLSMGFERVEFYVEHENSDFWDEWKASKEYKCIVKGKFRSLPRHCKIRGKKISRRANKNKKNMKVRSKLWRMKKQ